MEKVLPDTDTRPLETAFLGEGCLVVFASKMFGAENSRFFPHASGRVDKGIEITSEIGSAVVRLEELALAEGFELAGFAHDNKSKIELVPK